MAVLDRIRQDERLKGRDDLQPDVLGHSFKLSGNLNTTLSDTDRYRRGALDLHLHCVVGDLSEHCLIFRNVFAAEGLDNLFLPRADSWPLPADDDVPQSLGDYRELAMAVLVREPIENAECVALPSVLWRLQSLEDCDRLCGKGLDYGRPARPTLDSLRVLPWDDGPPDSLEEDREFRARSLFIGHQGAHQVLKAGPQVVNHVCGDDGDIRVFRAGRELQPPDSFFLLALEAVGHGVRVKTVVAPGLPFEIDEVLFGSPELQPV